MDQRQQILQVPRLDGGINENDAYRQPNEVADAENVLFANGYVEKRKGCGHAFSISAPGSGQAEEFFCSGLYEWSDQYGIVHTIACFSSIATNALTLYIDGASKVSGTDFDSAGAMGPFVEQYELFSFAVINYDLYCTNGLNHVYKISSDEFGTITIATLSANDGSYSGTYRQEIPLPKYIAYHYNRLFLAGVENFINRVYFSDIDDADSFLETSFFDINPISNVKITGLISYNKTLLVFTDRSIWSYTGFGLSDGELTEVVSHAGAISPESIKIAGNHVYFMAEDGIYRFDGVNAVNVSEIKLNEAIRGLDKVQIENAVAGVYESEHQYWVAVPERGQKFNNLVLVYDYYRNVFAKFRFTAGKITYLYYSQKSAVKSSAKYFMMIGQAMSDTGFSVLGVLQYGLVDWDWDQYASIENSTDGMFQPIKAFVETGDLYRGDISDKSLRQIYFDFKREGNLEVNVEVLEINEVEKEGSTSYTITLNQVYDGTSPWWDTAVWDTDKWRENRFIRKRIDIPQEHTSSDFRIKLKNNWEEFDETASNANKLAQGYKKYPLSLRNMALTTHTKGMR